MQRKRAMSADSTPQARDSVVICVSALYFDSTGLLLQTPSSLTVPIICRLPAHCSLRAHITSAEWATAAATAFNLPDVVSARLFDAFFVLSQSAQTRIEYTRSLLMHMQEEKSFEAKAAQRTVPLVGFMLFLMAQLFLEKQANSARPVVGEVSLEYITQFVKQQLTEIITIAGLGRHGRITHAELAELRGLFREFTLQGQEAPFGTGLTHLWPTHTGGAAPTTDVNALVAFVRSKLVLLSEVRNGLATTAVHRNLQSQTAFITSAPPLRPHSSLRILRFALSIAYVAAPLPHTVVSSCSNSTIVLGPVGGCLTLDNLDRCQVVALCVGIVVSRCRHTTVYVCTNSPPVLGDGNEGVLFAPYDSYYPNLEEHLPIAGVNPKLNLFSERLPPSAMLPPEQFAPIVVPLPASSAASTAQVTRSCPCALPAPYAEAARARAKRAQNGIAAIQQAYRKLESAGRKDLATALRTRVQNAFVSWLEQTGQAQSVAELIGPPA